MPRHPICSGVFQTSFRSANDGIQIQNNLWIPSNVLCSKISKLGCPFFLGFERFFFKQGRIFLIFWSDHGFPGSSKQGVLLTAWDGRGELAEWVALRMMWCHYLPILLYIYAKNVSDKQRRAEVAVFSLSFPLHETLYFTESVLVL